MQIGTHVERYPGVVVAWHVKLERKITGIATPQAERNCLCKG